MFDSEALIAKRYGNSRPGLQLIRVVEAALPVTQLRVDVIAQEHKALPLLDEFVIRLADLGIRKPEEMANILGLDLRLAESAIVEQLATDNLRRAPGSELLVELTPEGRTMAVELESTRPVQRPLPVSFDRLTWSITPYRPEYFVKKQEATERGLIVLPAVRSQRISPPDITVAALNKLIAEGGERGNGLDVLAVESVSSKKHRYFPVKLLIFADGARTEVQLGVVVDGQLSDQHERALLDMGGPEALDITVTEPAERPALPADLEAVRITNTDSSSAVPSDGSFDSPKPAGEVRDISVHEHPDILREALTNSRRRLLIIAPWIKSQVVDTTFISSLERLLRRRVNVHIAYGIGHDDSGSHPQAISRLRNLSNRYSEFFTFTRLKNSHAKILISDDIWITTSFNWLSFRGDPNRTYRMEEGVLIRIPERVEETYQKYLRMIDEQSALP